MIFVLYILKMDIYLVLMFGIGVKNGLNIFYKVWNNFERIFKIEKVLIWNINVSIS